MSDDRDLGPTEEEPSAEDFEAAAEERPQAGPRSVLARVLRAIGVVFVVVAVLLYLVVPVYHTVVSVQHVGSGPASGPRRIPVAPEPTSTPLRRT